ncbi:MAG: cytochrome C biogenesis protein [Actinobacteria bacterium]|nr:cytochrome C biogenesis protein [Actinomycetota bacterium]
MLLVLGAVVAGMLTTLAPCVLPVLPVVIGGAMAPQAVPVAVAVPAGLRGPAGPGGPTDPGGPAGPPLSRRGAGRIRRSLGSYRRPLVITASLGASVVVFTLLLKATTALIGIPPEVWRFLSGGLLVTLGLVQVFPALWEAVSERLLLGSRSGGRLAAARRRGGVMGEVLTGAALGPVFSSCSPLYGYVVVTLLPAEPAFGLVLLLAYTAGLCATLLVIAMAGQRAVRRLRWAADPDGWFRRVLGLVLIGVGLLVLLGADRTLQAWVIQHSPIRPWELDTGFIPR